MFGAQLRCLVCNQYMPDRCTCNKTTGFVLHGIDAYLKQQREAAQRAREAKPVTKDYK